MIKGGYKIVNFNGAALSGVAETLPGIYDQIVDDYDKPIMVSSVSLNGDIMDDAYAGVQEKIAGDLSKSVELTVYGGIITVTEDDEVSFVSVSSNAELDEDIADITSKAIMKTSAITINTDANEASYGWAYYGGSATNTPSATAYYILTLIHDVTKCQLAISRTTGTLYTRSYTNNAWTEWQQATNV